MDLKRNERFFKQNDTLRLVSGGMLIIGLIWFWVGWSAASYYVPCVIVPLGLVLFLVASARHVPESEIRGNIQKALAELGQDVEQASDFHTRVLKMPAPYRGESFVFDERARAARRGKDAKLLSDLYQATVIYFTQEALLVRGMTVDLSGGTVTTDAQKILWSELAMATVIPYEVRIGLSNKKNTTAMGRGAWLEVQGSEGEILYRAAVPNDMDADDLCSQINKRAAKE